MYNPSKRQWMVHNWRITSPRWQTAAIWKYTSRCISASSWLICTKFGVLLHIGHTGARQWMGPKTVIVGNSKWRQQLSWMLFLDHISVFDKGIWVKFRKLAIRGLSWPKIKLSIKFKIAAATILKIHKQVSPNFWPIHTKLGVLPHIGHMKAN